MYAHERSLVEELKEAPFALIGINSDSLDKARAAVEKNSLTWRSFQNKPKGAKKPISADWSVQGWPTLVVLDAERKIRYRGHDGEEATKVVRSLIAAMPQALK